MLAWFDFTGPAIEWRGPAPFVFVDLPQPVSDDLKAAAAGHEYWGQVPVVVRIADVEFFTALFPKDGRYLLPLRVAVRTPTGIGVGATVYGRLRVGRPDRAVGRTERAD